MSKNSRKIKKANHGARPTAGRLARKLRKKRKK